MAVFTDLPPRGTSTPIEHESYGDPAIPPSVTPQADLLKDADDNTGVLIVNWDRTKKSVYGCAARVLVPVPINSLNEMRIHGRFLLVSKNSGAYPDPTVYALVKNSSTGATLGELSVTLPQSFVAGTWDMGSLTGLNVVGDSINLLVIEVTGESLGTPEGGILAMLSEFSFDYTEYDVESVPVGGHGTKPQATGFANSPYATGLASMPNASGRANTPYAIGLAQNANAYGRVR